MFRWMLFNNNPWATKQWNVFHSDRYIWMSNIFPHHIPRDILLFIVTHMASSDSHTTTSCISWEHSTWEDCIWDGQEPCNSAPHLSTIPISPGLSQPYFAHGNEANIVHLFWIASCDLPCNVMIDALYLLNDIRKGFGMGTIYRISVSHSVNQWEMLWWAITQRRGLFLLIDYPPPGANFWTRSKYIGRFISSLLVQAICTGFPYIFLT